MKLWQKNYKLNKEIEKFTVGNDFLLDQKLVKYDCIASMAHAKMLNKIGILNKKELKKIIIGLKKIIQLNSKGKFKVKLQEEDCHTAIENYLTKNYGDVGKKIHTARSRNDQVLTALRLYEKDELKEIKKLLVSLKKEIQNKIKEFGQVKIPGYTHMQKAMLTTVETWLGCFSSSIDDNLQLLENTIKLIDQSPLGSGAGFEIPVFDIDKEMTADLMHFSSVMKNPLYTQMSRGKFESTILHLLTQVMFDLNKLSTDLILFNMEEFNFISLPKQFCTGSSIMPHKKNPDVLELIRAKYSVVLGEEFKIKNTISNLISGYNRDLQLTKEPLFKSIGTTKSCLEIIALVVSKLKINQEECEKNITPEMLSTKKAYQLVKEGLPFREVYQKVGKFV